MAKGGRDSVARTFWLMPVSFETTELDDAAVGFELVEFGRHDGDMAHRHL
jgi:hypothetical protein